jgi:effector-binding domain-containing protein
MESSVTLREEPARTVVYVRRQGPYTGIPDALQTLHRHLKSARLTPAAPPVGVFFTDPRQGPPADARWEMQWPIAEHHLDSEPGADGVGIRNLAKRQLAVTVHTGPYDKVGLAYDHALHWLTQQGYKVVGPPEEAYLSEPDAPPEKIRTEVRFPVARTPVSIAT